MTPDIRKFISFGFMLCAGIFVGRVLFPKIKFKELKIPLIVTQYDTVDNTPKWLEDSIKIWKKRKYQTDTIPLIVTETKIETEFVYVGSDTSQRQNLWPVLSYHGGRRFGDTASVVTFSLRDGSGNVSKVYIPGILTDLEVREGQATPAITFAPFPAEEKHNWFYPVKNFLLGTGAGLGACSILK